MKSEKDNNLNSPPSNIPRFSIATVVIIIITTILGVVAGLFFVYLKNKNLETVKNNGSQLATGSPLVIAPESVRQALLSKSFLVFPKVKSRKEVSVSELPKELPVFIKKEARDLKTEKITYTGETGGFYIQYGIPNVPFVDLFNEFSAISRGSGWKILTARRANLFAFLDLENSVYRLRISQMLKNETDGEITIEILKK